MEPFYHTIQQPTDIPQTSGIYRITCTITKKFYIGSAINLYRRRHNHFSDLQRNEHKNPKLQNAFNKYTESTFTFDVLELVLPPFLIEREQYWLDKLQAVKKGFNIAPNAGSTLGRECSPETRAKISTANTGKLGNIGYKPSPEIVERHRLRMLGSKASEESKRKMGNSRRGKIHTPEAREKIRLASIGHAPTHTKTFIVTAPDGTEYRVEDGLRGFCREHGLSSSTLVQVAKGKRAHHKMWTARYPDIDIS